MKKHFISFVHQPKKVIALSLIIAIGLGIFGYIKIHKIPTDQLGVNNGVPTVKNLSLGFLSSGAVETVSVKVGDRVKKGQVLATLSANNMDGSLIQAQATYTIAQANYQKIINGATGATVDLAKAALNTATVNLDEITKQQEVLVNNAHQTLLNSALQVQNSNSYNVVYDNPTVTGTYECKDEGTYNLATYGSAGGIYVKYSGIEAGNLLLTDVPRPLGNCGLSLSFDKTKTLTAGIEYYIQIPNKNAVSYSANYNTYQLALQNRDQAIAVAQASLNQANASLEAVVTSARPEDVAVAKAQVDNAYGVLIANPTYNNTRISAPGDGTITAVYISQGQTIVPNTPAIGFLGLSN